MLVWYDKWTYGAKPRGAPVTRQERGRGMTQRVLPWSMPIVAAVMVLCCCVDRRDEWFHATVVIRNDKRVALQAVARSIVIEAATGSTATAFRSAMRQATFGEVMNTAAAVVAMLQIIRVFPFPQRHFLRGRMVGAITA
jgi:ABC-type glycerol-3-phosphate transport system permease component